METVEKCRAEWIMGAWNGAAKFRLEARGPVEPGSDLVQGGVR